MVSGLLHFQASKDDAALLRSACINEAPRRSTDYTATGFHDHTLVKLGFQEVHIKHMTGSKKSGGESEHLSVASHYETRSDRALSKPTLCRRYKSRLPGAT